MVSQWLAATKSGGGLGGTKRSVTSSVASKTTDCPGFERNLNRFFKERASDIKRSLSRMTARSGVIQKAFQGVKRLRSSVKKSTYWSEREGSILGFWEVLP